MLQDLEAMPLDTTLAFDAARDRLNGEFAGQVGAESVDSVLRASWDHVDAGARIKHHVPLLAERFARGQLWALARMAEHDGVPAVLFLDTHDGGRAKMAKGLLLQQVGDAVHAFSAGTDPEIDVVPAVLETMHEVGVSLDQSFPKPYTEEMLQVADLVVSFGDGESVATSNGTAHEHWDVGDPRGRSLDEVRAIRADIAERVTDLSTRLQVEQTTSR